MKVQNSPRMSNSDGFRNDGSGETDKTLNCKPTGELVFGVARIFASFNDTFVHVTDLRCVPTIPTATGKRKKKQIPRDVGTYLLPITRIRYKG